MAVTARNYSSVAVATTLSAGINSSVTAFNIAANTGWPAAPFIAVLDPNTVNEEIVLVSAAAGTSWSSVTRGYDSSAAVSHNAGGTVQHMVVGVDFREAQNHAVSSTSNVHSLGVGSVVVGTTDSQTLTNKTLTAPTLNSPTFGTALPTGTTIGLGGSGTNSGTLYLDGGTASGGEEGVTLLKNGTAKWKIYSLDTTQPNLYVRDIANGVQAITVVPGATPVVDMPSITQAGVPVVTTTGTATLSNKTLTSPSISNPSVSGTATGSLTNLALTTPAISGSGGALTLPAGPGTLFATSNFQRNNFLDNPCFLINQFGGNRGGIGAAQYRMDRWYYTPISPVGNTGFGGSGFSNGASTASGSYAYWNTPATTLGSATAGSMYTVEQRFAFGDIPFALSGKQVTFSLSAAVVTSYKLNVRWVVNYGTGGSPSATTTTSLGSLTFSTGSTGTFSRQSVTATLPSFSGTWGSNSDGYVSLVLEQDYTNATSMGVNVADAQLELGPVATAFIPPAFHDDLRRCQKYYNIFSSSGVMAFEGWVSQYVASASGAVVRAPINFPTTMIGTPTLSHNFATFTTAAPTAITQVAVFGPAAGGLSQYWTAGTFTSLAATYVSGPSITNYQTIVPLGVNKMQLILSIASPQAITVSTTTNPAYPNVGQGVMIVAGANSFIAFSSEP